MIDSRPYAVLQHFNEVFLLRPILSSNRLGNELRFQDIHDLSSSGATWVKTSAGPLSFEPEQHL